MDYLDVGVVAVNWRATFCVSLPLHMVGDVLVLQALSSELILRDHQVWPYLTSVDTSQCC